MKKQMHCLACLACLAFALVFLALLVSYGCIEEKRYCKTDFDCVCGMDKLGKCDFGNKDYVQQSRDCREFCQNLSKDAELKCISGRCTFVAVVNKS
jgi:hypothetical protein